MAEPETPAGRIVQTGKTHLPPPLSADPDTVDAIPVVRDYTPTGPFERIAFHAGADPELPAPVRRRNLLVAACTVVLVALGGAAAVVSASQLSGAAPRHTPSPAAAQVVAPRPSASHRVKTEASPFPGFSSPAHAIVTPPPAQPALEPATRPRAAPTTQRPTPTAQPSTVAPSSPPVTDTPSPPDTGTPSPPDTGTPSPPDTTPVSPPTDTPSSPGG
jgi:hypothetical protein